MRHARTRLITGGIVLLLAAAWAFAGPAQLGGRTTYVATHGISMEPRFHTGDLALVRPAARYGPGDVVAYRSAVLHRVVLHRIVRRDGDRYVFRGDNNNFDDPVHPARDELIGRLWVRVPHGGLLLSWMHLPVVAAVLCGLVALLFVWPAARRGRRRGRRRGGGRTPMTRRPPLLGNPNAQALVTGCGVVAVLCLLLGLLAWTRPATHAVAAKVPYAQKARFSYRADAPAGAVYPDGVVRTGDPIFLRLVREVRVKIAYALTSATAAPAGVSGTEAVDVRLSSPGGWKRTLRVQEPTPFHGAHTISWVTLDLTRLQELIRRVEDQTGAPSGAAFTVEVLPRVHVKGTLAGRALTDRYSPALTFQLDPLQLRAGSGAAAPAAFNPSRPGALTAAATTPNRLSLGRFGIDVETARWTALLGLILALVVAVLTRIRERRRPTDLTMQIHQRYRHLIVPISSIIHTPGQPIVDVMSIDALAQVAERCERVILHHHRIGAESYLVDDEGTLYRYQPRPAAPLQAVVAAA